MTKKRLIYSRDEMLQMNKQTLMDRAGVTVDSIAKIAHDQQAKYTKDIPFSVCVESVEKILSLRDIFHHVQLGGEIDRLAEEGMFKGPIQDILFEDLGLFGIDEVLGLDIAGLYGVIGVTNFGDIDVNKPGIVKDLNDHGKGSGVVHTFLDDIVGAIAAAASTRVAQIMNEEIAKENPHLHKLSIYDILEEDK